MDLHLNYTDKQLVKNNVKISGSKSESNRLLILKQWFSNLTLENLSDSDDTNHLQKALNTTNNLVDIGHAGTAMRFLTAYFSILEEREVTLTGSDRMQNRPISLLVDALRSLGANITYVDKEGYPPLLIKGKKITKEKVQIPGNISSQYISALLLVAPHLENGLEIELLDKITSKPYLEMTLSLLKQLGLIYSWENNSVKIHPKKNIDETTITVESDWSSASYFYSLIGLCNIGSEVTLSSYRKRSLQGDSCLAKIYEAFGVDTKFDQDSIKLSKIATHENHIELDLKDAPDIAQTIAVTCFGLGIGCDLTGLHTLKIKETDRLVALKNELQKLGAEIDITEKSLHLKNSNGFNKNISIETYKDHRMAMAFAPLALKTPLTIKDADVVTKSYVEFWQDFDQLFH